LQQFIKSNAVNKIRVIETRCDAVKPSLNITKNQRWWKPTHVSKHSSLSKKPTTAFSTG